MFIESSEFRVKFLFSDKKKKKKMKEKKKGNQLKSVEMLIFWSLMVIEPILGHFCFKG